MTLAVETRVSDLYIGNGVTKEFAFPFKIFNTETDITVLQNGDGDMDVVIDPSLYTITLNSDQDAQPGGKVTFYTAPDTGVTFVIQSTIPYLQSTEITNMGDFYPDTLNLVHDKTVALIQQLKEKLERTLTVAATSSHTADELLALLNTIVDDYDDLMALPDTLRKLYQDLYDQAVADMQAIIKQLREMETEIEEGWGVSCNEETWTITEDIPAGSIITLPEDMFYIVGHHHLRLSWNGLLIYIDDENWSEVGEKHQKSTQFVINFDLVAGDVLNAWTGPLGTGETTDMWDAIGKAIQSLDALAEKVVYHEDVSNGN